MTVLKFIKIMKLHYDWLDLSPRFVADIYEILRSTNLRTLLHFSSDTANKAVGMHKCVHHFEILYCDTLRAPVSIDTPTQHTVWGPILFCPAQLSGQNITVSASQKFTQFIYEEATSTPNLPEIDSLHRTTKKCSLWVILGRRMIFCISTINNLVSTINILLGCILRFIVANLGMIGRDVLLNKVFITFGFCSCFSTVFFY